MYILLEVEIKNSYDSGIEYIDERVIGKYTTLFEAKTSLEYEVASALKRGYFNIVITKSDNRVILTNGGSYHKLYSILD